ncbi:MAG TPA: hypothetical protein VF405_16435 [Gammaproteobacteria bacterium]
MNDDRVLARPPTRRMTVIAQDPAVRRGDKIVMATIDVPAEDLDAGPIGYRVQIVDFDSTERVFRGSHELPAAYDDEPKSWQEGNASIQRDFRFHAQNTYALVMKTLARFEFALGRRIPWSFRTHQLKVAPHGMADPNAFYSPEAEGLVFGYFNGFSGERVFTCLSHDIIVHETTHALLDALRERYMDPSNPDQAAFHEGYSDVIALLSVFAQPEVVEHLLLGEDKPSSRVQLISRSKVLPEALRKSALFGLAEEMGAELAGVRGKPLRASAEIEPSPALKDSAEFLEPHRRGELFVAAVMQGFIRAWSRRVLESGLEGQKQFPLRRVAQEGADVADTLATMWIRAIDYMPPVNLRFGDALSAALTSDHEVRPDDSRYELRKHMTESFAAFGFAPASKRKDGRWSAPPEGLKYDRVRFESMKSDKDEVFRFIWDNREKLRLQRGAYTEVLSVMPSTRIGVDGFTVRETVVQYYQVARLTPDEMRERGVRAPREYLRMLGELVKAKEEKRAAEADDDDAAAAQDVRDIEADTTPLYGGAVLIFDEYGRVKYWVHNNVFGADQSERLAYLWQEGLLEPGRGSTRLRATRLSTLHRLRAIGARVNQQDRW